VITDPCSSAAFSIDPIPTINVQVPSSSILQQSYTVTNSFTNLHPTIICNYNPVSLTPEVTYLSFDSQYIFVDQSKVSTADEGTYSFTLTVNSLEYSATATAGNQTVTIKIAVVIDCPNIKLNTSTSIIQPVAYIILLSSHDVQ
jgi:predicted glycosyltransferase involved in capsule biosynthesis